MSASKEVQLNEIKKAVSKFYLDMDSRKNARVAQSEAFQKIESILGMYWAQGNSKNLGGGL